MSTGLKGASVSVLIATLTLAAAGASTATEAGNPAIDENRARLNYMLHCQGCHAEDGRGLGESIPTLKGFVGNFLKVAGGRAYLVQVPGSANSPFTNAELAEVLNWIIMTMSPAELPRDFIPFTADEVASYRATSLANAKSVRAALIAQLDSESSSAAHR